MWQKPDFTGEAKKVIASVQMMLNLWAVEKHISTDRQNHDTILQFYCFMQCYELH